MDEFGVVINCEGRSWLAPGEKLLKRLLFIKSHKSNFFQSDGYICFSPKSLGELDRSLGNIPDNPTQMLTDWTVTLDSACSSVGGESTVDWLYYLESINNDFDLIGLPAMLCTEQDILRNFSVVAAASGGGTVSITFSERIGCPQIPKSESPVFLGNSSGGDFYWPVELSRDEKGFYQVLLSSESAGSDGKLYIYSEKREEYMEVRFASSKFENGRIVFIENVDENLTAPLLASNFSGLWPNLTRTDANKLRNPEQEMEPAQLLIDDGEKSEHAYIWQNQLNSSGTNAAVELCATFFEGRAKFYHEAGTIVKRMRPVKLELLLNLLEPPEKIAETGDYTEHKDFFANMGKGDSTDANLRTSHFYIRDDANSLTNIKGYRYPWVTFEYLPKFEYASSGGYVDTSHYNMYEQRMPFCLSLFMRDLDLPKDAQVMDTAIGLDYKYNAFGLQAYIKLSPSEPIPAGSLNFILKNEKQMSEIVRVKDIIPEPSKFYDPPSGGFPTLAHTSIPHSFSGKQVYHLQVMFSAPTEKNKRSSGFKGEAEDACHSLLRIHKV